MSDSTLSNMHIEQLETRTQRTCEHGGCSQDHPCRMCQAMRDSAIAEILRRLKVFEHGDLRPACTCGRR